MTEGGDFGEVLDLVQRLDSYTEVSSSGKGIEQLYFSGVVVFVAILGLVGFSLEQRANVDDPTSEE